VAALGRNVATGQQVWSASHGYPGDPDYREFHSKDSESGMRYWRVTGPNAELDQKAYWDPWRAFERTSEHARHFAMLVEAQLREYHASSRRAGIISAAYDTELFGHWWFEGIAWLKDVLRLLARSDIARLTGAAEYVRECPPEEVVELPEGSWGQEGTHFVWNNDQVAWMWPVINERQARMEEIVSRPCEGTQAERALDQLARELFLLESSD
jgi:1,4-alpha-glucan branching enzyme